MKDLKYLTLPTVFISNLLVYIFIGSWIDKKYGIGNYMILFILFGIVSAMYSTYKVVKSYEK